MFWRKKELLPDDNINMFVVSTGSDVQAYEEAKMVLHHALTGERIGSSLHIMASFVMRWYPVISAIENNIQENKPKDTRP